MKKSVMKKWVAALRSGEYKQGFEGLSNNGKYCCLGVLCEVLGARKRIGYFGHVVYGSGYETNPVVLPRSIRRISGVKNETGKIVFGERHLSLVDLNDVHKRSFKYIATYIERNWEKL